MLENGLIIFIKNPVLGKVKTRLAMEVGDVKALAVYNALLNHTRKISLEIDVNRYLFYHESIENDQWSEDDFIKGVQLDGDLGRKMADAFSRVLSSQKKAVIIGSDCPQISSDLIFQAFKSLSVHDLVIGPTFDGGYYLLGMKSLYNNLFSNIKWSTDQVFQRTIERAKLLQISYFVLPKLSDVDYKEDWEKYGWKL